MLALIFCGDLKYCPYIWRYIERLEKTNTPFCVLFWNRGGVDISLPENYLYYDTPSDLRSRKIKKVLDFLGFRKWLLNKIQEIKPDKIIALSSLVGVLLGKTLYNGNIPYAFDIRDYSYEHIRPFYWIEKQVIKRSAFTAISSAGFRAFLPKHNYVIAHNFNRNDILERATFKKTDGKINFVWNGVVRYFEYQKQYLDALKNDPRFHMIFHGDGPELVLFQEYCVRNSINNITFTGAYNNADKVTLLRDAHILNNCYGCRQKTGNELRYAVSNRFYDGMIYHIPQIVEPEGFKTEWTSAAGIGTAILPGEEFADKLYEYYRNIDNEAFDRACGRELQRVIEEDNRYVEVIDDFIVR